MKYSVISQNREMLLHHSFSVKESIMKLSFINHYEKGQITAPIKLCVIMYLFIYKLLLHNVKHYKVFNKK